MRLRAEAHGARAAALGLLAAEYGRKIADVRMRLSGPALAAALAALRQEHVAAERALSAKLSGQARDHRREALASLRRRRKERGGRFHNAAETAGARPPPRQQKHRQRRRRCAKISPRPRR